MFPMSDDGSFLFPGSLKPPILQPPAANSSGLRPAGSPACWVILDTAAYIADRKNGTYAKTTTRTGQDLGVSFWLADPPAVSHLCVHCPGMSVADFLDEPLVVGSGKDVAVIRVAYAFGARPIESMEDMGVTDFDYFIYRAGHAKNPSLELLPNPKPLFFESKEIGFLPSADGEDFLLAVLQPRRRVPLQYDLHIFSSRTNEWTTELALLEPPSPRSCAEEAIRVLNGVQIDRKKGLSLSWSSSKLHKVPPKRRLSERNSTSYHPYQRLYGLHSYKKKKMAARGNND
ncbi:hypothetical protein C2845_PM01G08420 [Panicum miliaceum]|uniref:DUF1618 domain-containing protein n=1 Tax=Panicum miliaceum TaxID=4540 RepID=A0A3L6TG91_PANMI|nr:hypothetical protein C2845_PM01G08420 [Panicum miliaceum]